MDQTEPTAPDRLPEGVELPDGTYLDYPASRDCPCAHCVGAWKAWEDGTLIVFDDDPDSLPW